MSSAINGLKPQLVWKYFAEIATVPRPSKHEEKIVQYVLAKAKSLGLEAKKDRIGNVLVKKPASRGKEKVPVMCLQGHLDMVCEKNADKKHDFMKDPLQLVRKGNILKANGTTLGADNGIAVATMLAIAEDKSLVHGPLELLFTIDEETGLTGASNLDAELLKSKTMMNLDSEEEGALYVGCSGGRDSVATWKLAYDNAPAGSVAATVSIKGLRGGHSGLEIHAGRGNAIKIFNRVLIGLTALGARLSSVNGGNKRNAIPRETVGEFFIPADKIEKAKALVATMNTTMKAELSTVEPDLAVTLAVAKGKAKGKVIKLPLQKKIAQTIMGLPHGVLKMSADIPGLVETSTNVAVLTTAKNTITLATSQRSSVASELNEAVDIVSAIMKLGGASVVNSDGYPGWKPNLKSPILKIAKQTYTGLFKKEPEVKAIHAGLECGIIGERIPGMDMVSFGPTLMDVHSPDERIYIDSVDKFWKLLITILKNWK